MTAKHTPEVWYYEPTGHPSRPAFLIRTDYVAIAQTYERNQSLHMLMGSDNPEADARLIVSAPKLLAALKAMLEPYGAMPVEMFQGERNQAAIRNARAAIAKAEDSP